MNKIKLIILTSITLILTACGGGNSSDNSTPPIKTTPIEIIDEEIISEPIIEEVEQEAIPKPTVQITPIVIDIPTITIVEPESIITESISTVIKTPIVIPEPEPIVIIKKPETIESAPLIIEELVIIKPIPIIEELIIKELIIEESLPLFEPVVEETIIIKELVDPEPVEEFYKISQIDNDLDVDGIIDITRKQTTFDDRGNILTKNYRDKYGDPEAPGHTSTYTYNDKDQVLTYEYDVESDGTKDSYGTYIYDLVGNLISWTRNGYFISYGHMVYDINNNLIENWYFTDDDESHYGYNTMSTYTYIDGNIVIATTDRFNGNEPNGIDDKWEYDYDINGNQIYQSQLLQNGEEAINYSFSTYEENHIITFEHNFGFSTIYTYDDNWNLILRTNFQDNIQISQTVRTYDINNNMLSVVGQNGYEVYWIYDENNNLLSRKSFYEDNNDSGWYTNTYTYIDNNMISDSADYKDDGINDFVTRYTYDENNNQLSSSWARGDEVDIHQIEYYTWKTFIK